MALSLQAITNHVFAMPLASAIDIIKGRAVESLTSQANSRFPEQSGKIEKIDETGEMVLALGPIDDKPMVRVVNAPTSSTAIAVDFGAFRSDPTMRDRIRNLYPNARKLVVDSSHQIALTSPDVVTSAIREVMSAAGCNSRVAARSTASPE